MYLLYVHLATFTVCNLTFEDTLRKASIMLLENLVLDNANTLQAHLHEASLGSFVDSIICTLHVHIQ